MALGKLFHLSRLQCSQLQNGDNIDASFLELLEKVNALIYVKYLKQCLAHSITI